MLLSRIIKSKANFTNQGSKEGRKEGRSRLCKSNARPIIGRREGG